MNPVVIYDYLTRTRGRVPDAVPLLSPHRHRQVLHFGLATIASTVTHIMVSAGCHAGRVEGGRGGPA
ncbi:MAG: hypothetical protein IT433_05380 [Phycisphaerales bacterium]|nr:hypothetical protein [Phycisphaerales bacterium]